MPIARLSLLIMFVLPWFVLPCAVLAGQPPAPKMAASPLTADQLAIYRDFLRSYDNGSHSELNVSEVTEPLAAESFGAKDELKGCLKALTPLTGGEAIHRLPAEVLAGIHARLVDPEKHKRNDPGDAIRSGVPVDQAVEAGFAAGLFTFSEIVFSRDHKLAAFSYSFVCGRLCGNGGIVMYALAGGKWRPAKRRCAEWVS